MARYLITSALPYANGSIHLGHMVEHIQTDVMARFLRLEGHEVLHVCADDTHGTPIELNAQKQGITPEELIARSLEEHTRDFAGFHIGFDSYYTTNSPENEAMAGAIYLALKDAGMLEKKVTQQLFSESLGRFLPDRLVRGTCPKCGAADQYGDACEVCNSTYEPTDLINPVDAIEGKTPVLRENEQIYVRLSEYDAMLRSWLPEGVPQESVRNFVQPWLDGGLQAWCISRQAPYFGFPIPGEVDKFFYVWLDAPVGYIAATQHALKATGGDWRQWWSADSDAHVIHVIGKDIVYFHTLFWPAMLHAANLRKPSQVHVHGFLTVNGAKMSKSRGTFIQAAKYLETLHPDYLRFYITCKLSDGVEDLDLNLDDLVFRTNADLVNNVVNLCSRTTKFIEQKLDGQVSSVDPTHPIARRISEGLPAVRDAYARWDYRAAIRRIAELGDVLNLHFQEQEPWKLLETDVEAARAVCSVVLHGAVALMTALSPVVPSTAQKMADCIGVDALSWKYASSSFKPAAVRAEKTFLARMDRSWVDGLIDTPTEVIEAPKPLKTQTNKHKTGDKMEESAPAAPAGAPFKAEIEFDDFAKVDLRVGVVVAASTVEGADKLVQLTVDIGKNINVFAGVRKAYADPSILVGKRVVVVANLKPRKMKFGISEGMLLATSAEDDSGLQLATLDASTQPGWTVR